MEPGRGNAAAHIDYPGADMAKSDAHEDPFDDLDAFFDAAGSENPLEIKQAAENLLRHQEEDDDMSAFVSGEDVLSRNDDAPAPAETQKPKKKRRNNSRTIARSDEPFMIPPEHMAELAGEDNLEGKFIAIDPTELGEETDAPFVLIPAHVYTYVPWWGWTAIGVGLLMLVAGVVFMPVWSLDRLASRLGDGNEANAQYAMRRLVMNGDERTVKKLFSMAASSDEGLTARLRAVDTMTLIGGVPEVDRALLRLELSGGTNEQVREAAIAARKQREAARTRGRR